MLIVKIVIAWFLISIIFSLILAQFLNINDTSESEEEVLFNQQIEDDETTDTLSA